MNGALVTTEWLEAELGSPDLAVFDASFFLPAEGKNAREEFVNAHIPGAQFFDIEVVADPETDLPHMVPSAGRFARLVGALGVSNRLRVVVYDQFGMRSARAWWLFGLFGHGQVAVLDGGFSKWQQEGRRVEQGEPPPAAPARFDPDFSPRILRGLGDMRRNLQTHAELVIDARPAGRFDGTAPEPRPGLPSGHMPGAVNVPAGSLVTADQRLLPPEELRARFAAAGVDGRVPLVTSCGTGVTAAIVTLGLTVAGLPPGALYDGSWTEWASRTDTPKETAIA